MTTIDITTLTKVERSIILYAESCSVEYGGLLEGMRMNEDDLVALRKFEEGILSFGRCPAALLEPLSAYGRKPTLDHLHRRRMESGACSTPPARRARIGIAYEGRRGARRAQDGEPHDRQPHVARRR